jgi:hypothetical protein
LHFGPGATQRSLSSSRRAAVPRTGLLDCTPGTHSSQRATSNGLHLRCGGPSGCARLYGMQTREDLLAREVGADPNKGVNPPAIVRAARARGLTAELRQGMTVREIAGIVRAGSPVLVALQAWSDKPRSSYREDWDDGHYAIIVAVDQDAVVFEDPSVLGSRAVLSRREFEDRWHDTDGTHRYVRMGIVFTGRTPAPPPARVPME